jgi:type IV pilus assembly protein PilM
MVSFGKTKSSVGLDIGSHSIKAVELKSKKRGGESQYELVKLAYEVLPRDAIVEGTIIDTNAVAEIIKMTFDENKIENKNVAISISGNSVIIKKISLPQMDPEELSESIVWEAKHNIPYAYDEINIDYAILDSPRAAEEKKLDVLIVAAKKDKIENYSNVVLQARKNLESIDVDAFALQNSLQTNYLESYYEKSLAIINIGAHIANIMVTENGIPQLFRDVAIGGFFFTENLSKEQNISFDEAEKLLKVIPEDNPNAEAIKSTITTNTNELLEEIEKTFTFHEVGEQKEKKIDQIFLSGGLAKLTDLQSHVQEKLNVETTILNPFQNIYYNDKKFDPVYMQDIAPLFGVALGLAIPKSEK